MQLFQRDYFDRFRCIADRCPDSCCKEWEVQVDPASAGMYRSLAGPLGDRLRQVLRDDPEYGTVMTIENRRCPMWRSDGLCRIQAELGEDALCRTCREFPRLTHDYGDFVELGLELSCPEAARLILTSPPSPLLSRSVPGGESPDYDQEIMEILLQTREQASGLLWDPAHTVPEALALLLFYGYYAQSLLDGAPDAGFDPQSALEAAGALALPGGRDAFLDFFSELEILTEEWAGLLKNPQAGGGWPEMLRNLAQYGIERYWLQAVSDHDLVGRVKFVIASCLLARLLGRDMIATAQLYSKEIENNAENVDAVLDGAYTHPALTDRRLLGLLV